jgi:hypothetical protein
LRADDIQGVRALYGFANWSTYKRRMMLAVSII